MTGGRARARYLRTAGTARARRYNSPKPGHLISFPRDLTDDEMTDFRSRWRELGRSATQPLPAPILEDLRSAFDRVQAQFVSYALHPNGPYHSWSAR